MQKKMVFCILFWISLIPTFTGCQSNIIKDFYPSKKVDQTFFEEESHTSEKATRVEIIYVHVCGCVKNPGLYSFSQGERIDAAIRAAGGFTKKADQQSVNLAEILLDGEQINVLSKEDTEHNNSSGNAKEQKININTADQNQLMTLQGIGEGKALAIISYRQEHGDFSSIEDIKEVSGIGPSIYDKIKNVITVE